MRTLDGEGGDDIARTTSDVDVSEHLLAGVR
jgi:hypothetical protein